MNIHQNFLLSTVIIFYLFNSITYTKNENLFDCKMLKVERNKIDNIEKTNESDQYNKFEILNNWLTIGISENIVIDSLGTPDLKGEDKYWGGTGTYVQSWEYKKMGIILDMESEQIGEHKKVIGITIFSPCNYQTKGKVGINSSTKFLKEKYGNLINKESTEKLIFIGSNYSGTYFYISNDVVSEIFIGTLGD